MRLFGVLFRFHKGAEWMYSGKDFDQVFNFIKFMVLLSPILFFVLGLLIGYFVWG
jgi:hypothetical protein